MPGFDWKTDSDTAWSEHDWQTEPDAPRKRRPRLMLWVSVVVLIAAVFIIYHQAQERAALAMDAAKDDLLSTHDLLRTALAQGDGELFVTLLSGRDSTWTEAQQELFEDGTLLNPRFLGLQPVPNANNPTETTAAESQEMSVEFSPEMLEAEVVDSMQYVFENQEGVTETVSLERTSIYRKGNSRWLLAPPLSEFWGPRIRIQRDLLTLTTPERDSELAGRLADDLNVLLDKLCDTFGAENCRQDYVLSVRLETRANSLVAAEDDNIRFDQGLALSLPTPSLVGTPVDEQGYEVLFGAYAERIASAAVAYLSDWQCCAHAALFQALLEWELSQLGLGTWPVTDETYSRILDEKLAISDIAHFWLMRTPGRLDGPDGWQVYLLLDFLIRRFPEVPILEMQRELSKRLTLEDWLQALYAPYLNPGVNDGVPLMQDLEGAWVQTAIDLSQKTQSPPPIPFPEQDILLACFGADSETGSIYRYSLETGAWSTELSAPGAILMMKALRDDEILVLSGAIFDSSEEQYWQTGIWDGRDLYSVLPDSPLVLSLGQTDPTGEHLVLIIISTVGDETPVAGVVEIDRCLVGECRLNPLQGLPTWAPGGRQAILIANESLGQSRLSAGAVDYLFAFAGTSFGWPITRTLGTRISDDIDDATVAVGFGALPFWLSDSVYGYVRSIEPSELGADQELVLATVSEDVPEAVLKLSDLKDLFTDGSREYAISMLDVVASRKDPSKLFVALSDASQATIDVVAIDLDTNHREVIVQVGAEPNGSSNGSIGFSPDERWLAVTGVSEDSGLLALYGLAEGAVTTYGTPMPNWPLSASYDWSQDGDWLAVITNDAMLSLVAPEFGYQYLIGYGFDSCGTVQWFSR